MLFKVVFGGLIFVGITSRLAVPVVRKVYGWKDTSTKEYKEKEIREWLESKAELPTISNSDGENWF